MKIGFVHTNWTFFFFNSRSSDLPTTSYWRTDQGKTMLYFQRQKDWCLEVWENPLFQRFFTLQVVSPVCMCTASLPWGLSLWSCKGNNFSVPCPTWLSLHRGTLSEQVLAQGVQQQDAGSSSVPVLCQFSPVTLEKHLNSSSTALACLCTGCWHFCIRFALQTQPALPQLGELPIPAELPLLHSHSSAEQEPECDVSLKVPLRDMV